MPPSDSAALIVARYLKASGLVESYQAFITEAGLSEDAGTVSKGDLTLETLLEEKKTFDLSVQFEKLGTSDGGPNAWQTPAPSVAREIDSIPSRSNILSTVVARVTKTGNPPDPVLLVSAADRHLHRLQLPSCRLGASISGLSESPILACAVVRNNVLLTTSMSGHLLATDFDASTLDRRRDHSKYAVKIAILDDAEELLVATAGWDMKVNIYRPTTSPAFRLNQPIATITLPTKPESIVLLRHPDTSQPIIILSRTDSNHLHYYALHPEARLLGKQNLAPHSNAWVAFTPSALALCPTDPSLLAVGTSSVPHMKLLIVRLLVPPYNPTPAAPPPATLRTSLLDDSPATTETQASQARAALAVAETEHAAISIHSNTWAPQTAYSTPAVAWRPDGSGVWVNGDDGAIRGIEVSSGKVAATLNGHEEGTKVRCLWAGSVEVAGKEEEMLVSGGFDQKLILWRV